MAGLVLALVAVVAVVRFRADPGGSGIVGRWRIAETPEPGFSPQTEIWDFRADKTLHVSSETPYGGDESPGGTWDLKDSRLTITNPDGVQQFAVALDGPRMDLVLEVGPERRPAARLTLERLGDGSARPEIYGCGAERRILRTAQQAHFQQLSRYGTEEDLARAGFLAAESKLYDTRPAASGDRRFYDIVVADARCGQVGSVVAPVHTLERPP